MRVLRLGLWLLRRERASGEWRVLLLALIIGVGSVSTTGFLGDRIKRAMSEQGARFLGADLLVTSPRPIDAWPGHALRTSSALEFASMVSRGDAFQLATLRAVDAAYPLRGEVRIADRPFEAGTQRPAMPPPGTVYADQELLTLLNAQVGDAVLIGEATFRIAGVVVEEPGQLAGVFGFAPRVFLRADDVSQTRVLQPGSRLTYLYQFAGEPDPLAAFADALKTRLDSTQRLMGSREGVETLRGAFANADRYLQLTALISLLLSVAAIAIAAHRHALRHYDQAALLRCMGATTAQLRTLYAVQLLTLGLLGSVAGVAIGALMQQALAGLILPESVARLPSLGAAPVGVAVVSGLLALAGASLPALMRLIRVPPLRVLRRDLPPLPVAAWLSALASGSALLILIAWYAGDARLVGIFVGALAALVGVLILLARLALMAGHGVQKISYGPLRFGLAQLLRHRFDSTLQLGAFTLALFLVALLALVRSDLVDGWRQQLPENAPNYFLVNIAPHQQEAVAAYLSQHRLEASALYPMVRGRLVSKDGVPIADTLPPEKRDSNSLRRELNLTWTATLPANNAVLAGTWHGERRAAAPVKGTPVGAPLLRSDPPAEISVESGMAERLQLAVGDSLGFQVGDQTLAARITSIRSVKWDSMQPNFFVIFAPGQLDDLPASSIASVYVPPDDAGVLPGFVKTFPGITVLALDKLIANIEAVFAQIIGAIQLLLGFLLAAGMAVVVATLLASLDARRQEAVLLRTLGAQRAYLAKGLWSEFIALGVLAGLLASVCAEIAMALIAERLFDLPLRLHPWLWLALPAAGALLVGMSGWLTTRHITRVPPMQSIRALG
ncbi:MAG: ABC transporter permease [Gammaproteobacteria bacterium]|nr:ABC transporter permease [Gammaproteobacteria bacterium]MBU1407717.1 ABC transporter permease [Gammaproteobacteria bacterium]MBU1531830.1 ABC transporter permease [Gammaproteobacteria bacterium]